MFDTSPGTRAALVISASKYEDPSLHRLQAPAQDSAHLVEVLADPQVGEFGVTKIIDETVQVVRIAIEKFAAERSRDDVALVYLSCHGVLSNRGQLYFATSDTDMSLLRSIGPPSQ